MPKQLKIALTIFLTFSVGMFANAKQPYRAARVQCCHTGVSQECKNRVYNSNEPSRSPGQHTEKSCCQPWPSSVECWKYAEPQECWKYADAPKTSSPPWLTQGQLAALVSLTAIMLIFIIIGGAPDPINSSSSSS